MRSTFPQWVLGVVALARGDLETAGDQFRAGVEHAGTQAAPRHQANSRWGLAYVSLTAGRVPEAARLHREALELRQSMGDHLGVAESLVGAAAVVASTDPPTAAALVDEAERLQTALGAVATPRQAGDLAAVRSLLRGREEAPEGEGPPPEALTVTRALRALRELEGSASVPAGGGEGGGPYGLAGG
jgi:hypothetical protein